MQTSEVLNRAADLIEERGWVKGVGWPGDGSGSALCLEGGIMAALGGEWDPDTYYGEFRTCPAHRAVVDYLSSEMGPDRSYLFQWNDAYVRTAAEVIEVLRAAALVEAAREQDREPVVVTP